MPLQVHVPTPQGILLLVGTVDGGLVLNSLRRDAIPETGSSSTLRLRVQASLQLQIGSSHVQLLLLPDAAETSVNCQHRNVVALADCGILLVLNPCGDTGEHTNHSKGGGAMEEFATSLQPARAYEDECVMMSGPLGEWPEQQLKQTSGACAA